MLHRATRLLSIIVALGLTARSSNGQTPSGGSAPPTPPQRLVIGDGYVVKVRRASAEERLVGDLAKASDRWIVLRCRTMGAEVGAPAAPKNALGPRPVFQNAGREVHDELLWIPRDAAIIERHHPRASKLPPLQLVDEAPPRQTLCTVELAAGYQVDRQEGEFLGWAGSDLALAQQPGQAPRRIAYGQILCLRFRQAP